MSSVFAPHEGVINEEALAEAEHTRRVRERMAAGQRYCSILMRWIMPNADPAELHSLRAERLNYLIRRKEREIEELRKSMAEICG